MEEKEELTANEAAEFLGVSRQTINNMVKRGDLKKYRRKYGKQRVYFLREDLMALKEGTEQEPIKKGKAR